MKRLKIIEMPKEEIRLDALEKAMIGAGDNCGVYEICINAQKSPCKHFNTSPCSCGGGLLYCISFQ